MNPDLINAFVPAGMILIIALLLTLPLVRRLLRQYLEFISNLRGGGPKGPHPLPANDSRILNRRRGAS